MRENLLNQVKIVPVDDIAVFEWHRPIPLKQPTLPVVRHPFLASPVGEKHYLLLENTDLFHQLRLSGLIHVPLLTCPLKSIHLEIPPLLLTGFSTRDLSRLAAQYPQQLVLDSGQSSLPSGYLEATIEFTGCPPQKIYLRHSSQIGCSPAIEFLFRAIDRVGEYRPDTGQVLRPGTPLKAVPPSAQLRLPAFTVDDLKGAAFSGRLFPSSVVWPIAPHRVLDIDYPLSVLKTDASSEEKEIFLRDLIAFRQQTHRTSFFTGQVYVLNR